MTIKSLKLDNVPLVINKKHPYWKHFLFIQASENSGPRKRQKLNLSVQPRFSLSRSQVFEINLLNSALALVVVFYFSLALVGSACADDTVVGLGAGGLEFRTTNKVSMVKERLTISPKSVDAHYTFRNTTDHVVELMVAFPLPVIDFSRINAHGPNINIPNSHSANFVEFKTFVDGKPVITATETKALAGDNDISAELKKVGINYWIPGYGSDYGVINPNQAGAKPHVDSILQLQALSQNEQHHLMNLGAIQTGEPADDAYPFPNWRLVTLYYWTQIFPPGKDVLIQHSYQPISTMSEGFNIQAYDPKTLKLLPQVIRGSAQARYPEGADNLKQYCMTDVFFETAKTKTAFQTYTIDFILKTANAWHKPIGEFTLVLQTDDPENMVSICMDGIKQTSETSFEVTKYNFAPNEDLKIFFLKKR
jgi:hypothetical protein